MESFLINGAKVLSAGLYLAALLLFLRGARKRGWKEEVRDSKPFVTREYGKVLLLCLLSLVLHMALVSALRLLTGRSTTLIHTLKIYSGLDSKHYFDIARAGYVAVDESTDVLNLVFFPGYPLLIGLFSLALPEMLSGYLAAWIPFMLAGMALYRLFRLDRDEKSSLRILIWLCLFPGAVFYSYPMSESMFLAAVAAALYLGRTKRWFAAGVCGFLAVLIRSPGVLVAVPLGVELLQQYAGKWKKEWKRFLREGACLLLLPLALLIYLWINAEVAGDPLMFLDYQKNHWHQEAGLFFNTAGTHMDYAYHTWTSNQQKFWCLWFPNLVVGFASLGLMVAGGRKLRISEGAWFFAYFAVCNGVSWLLSEPRYMTVFFPLAEVVEDLRLPKWLKWILLGIPAVLYTFIFGMRWSVW